MDPGQPPGLQGFDSSAASQARYTATQQLLTFDSGLSMVQAANAVTGHAVQFAQVLSSALKSINPLQTKFPGSYLGQQLQQVAQVIAAQSALGVKRQIFFCSVGGFDTHANQLPQQVQLLADVSSSMSAFYQATQELGVTNQVTQFTLSEFSRTHGTGNQRRVGPRLGEPPIYSGRRGEGQRYLRHVPDTRAGRAGRRRPEWPLDPHDGTGSICGDAGDVVWSQYGELVVHFPEPGEFSGQQSGVHGLAANEFVCEKTAVAAQQEEAPDL